MKRRYLFLAVAAAVAAGAAAWTYTAGLEQSEPAVVAVEDIDAWSRIESDMVKVIQVPRASLHPLTARNKADVVGRYTIQTIYSGEQLLKCKLAPSSAGAGGSVVAGMPGDMRAVFIPTQVARGAGGVLRGGDRVDLVFVSQEQKTGVAISRYLVRSAPVIDVRTDRGARFEGVHPNSLTAS